MYHTPDKSSCPPCSSHKEVVSQFQLHAKTRALGLELLVRIIMTMSTSGDTQMLPVEILDTVFQLAAFSTPESIPAIALVSKRVRAWYDITREPQSARCELHSVSIPFYMATCCPHRLARSKGSWTSSHARKYTRWRCT